MADKVSFEKGLSTALPAEKKPGAILLESDTGAMHVDLDTNTRITVTDKDAQTKITNIVSVVNSEYSNQTIASTGWSGNTYSFESVFPSAQYDITVAPANTLTTEQVQAWGAAIMTGNVGQNIITALGTVPTMDLPCMVEARKKYVG